MFTLEFDGATIQTENDFHRAVKEQSGIDWYGCNLGAFDEMLSFLIPCQKGPFQILWKNVDLSDCDTFPRYSKFVAMMKEAEERFPDRIVGFSMTFSEPYWDEGQDPFARMQS